MIDEDRTLQLFGYTSDELTPKSHKKVVAVCEECGTYRVIWKQGYRDLCQQCAMKNPMTRARMSAAHKNPSAETRAKISAANTNPSAETRAKLSAAAKNRSAETRAKLSEAAKNPSAETRAKMSAAAKNRSAETRAKMSAAKKNPSAETRAKISAANMGNTATDDTRIKMSCAHQGIDRADWDGFAVESPYCPKFNNACKERNRAKYGRTCFICGKTETENSKKLSVHHVDLNKDQGCDGHVWQLVPLCACCHAGSHNPTTTARLQYLLTHVWDEQ